MSAGLGTSLPLCWWNSVWISFGSGAFGRKVYSGSQDRPTWSKSCRMPSIVVKSPLLIGKKPMRVLAAWISPMHINDIYSVQTAERSIMVHTTWIMDHFLTNT